ncbi:hypothetical protein I7I53_04109 [Histoplasma capsulatum var. duboisii H88]|uniref:Uncharacterized protein n=1 Tax=Ajellomyces capsulatus (strain H88) TaxID=544711 RepID=A0A8A1LRQ4_AJEC8|nr:hypothetical protein I7I53_04109 [Histoplasma capsulatum var. duboisii H88]
MAKPRGRYGQIILAYKIDSGFLSVFIWIASVRPGGNHSHRSKLVMQSLGKLDNFIMLRVVGTRIRASPPTGTT